MKLIDEKITLSELKEMALEKFGDFVKAVIDIEREIMVVGSDLHADAEQYLLEYGSQQEDLWGVNLYPELAGEDFIEFDSMINIRPNQNNFSREIESNEIKDKIIKIINHLVTR